MSDIEKFQASVAEVDKDKQAERAQAHVKSLAGLLVSYQERLATAEKRRLNLSKWLPALGYHVRPLIPGDFVVVLADTGSGKTAFLQNIAYYAATPLPTMFFEIELADDLMCERMLAMHAQKTPQEIEDAIRVGKLPEIKDEFNHLRFCTLSSVTLEDIESIVTFHNAKSKEPVAVLIVDYMGLIKQEKGKNESRYGRFSDIAEGMKAMAKRLDVILFVSCQVRREAGEAASPIHLHAAKESGSIENSGGLILGVWREGSDGKQMKIKILKNTRGCPGYTVDAKFDGATMRITPDLGIPSNEQPYKDS